MSDPVEAAAARIVRAWTVAGPAPHIHRAEQARLRAQWPALARAVEELVRASGQETHAAVGQPLKR